MLIAAIITITLALVFYSVGVWSERLQGGLKRWHVIVFWVGFVFDTTGTTLMSRLTNDGFTFNFHGITGITAILLMFIHAVWATIVILHSNPRQKRNFHRFSMVVWIVWLIPFVSGMLFGVSQ